MFASRPHFFRQMRALIELRAHRNAEGPGRQQPDGGPCRADGEVHGNLLVAQVRAPKPLSSAKIRSRALGLTWPSDAVA